MMVETVLESAVDLAALPQWKRELLQRRSKQTNTRHTTPAPLPPPADDDEELHYGPGIVKRLKSRYLSLALRDAPKRRPSVLRRAASLEHLDRPPQPAPRPASLPAAPRDARRDAVKRARSVDALSGLDDDPPAPKPLTSPHPVPPAPPALPKNRPPRRPSPLLRDAERPPPDAVRSALRKFECAPVRRTAPAARVSAALRGLSATSETAERDRSPAFVVANLASLNDRPPRRVGVIKPMPAPRPRSPPPPQETRPSAAVEPRVRDKQERSLNEKRSLANIVEKFERRSPTPELENVERQKHCMGADVGWSHSEMSGARIERAWSGGCGGASVVFNFSSRKGVPDYIENDGLILKANRRDKLKAGDSGVVLLRDSVDAAEESDEERLPACVSPLPVTFVNDNVLINGRSSLTTNNKDRINKLKLQFDDSLTMTFEYPSETSLCEEEQLPTLGSYQPCKSGSGDQFALGLTRPPHLHHYDNGNGDSHTKPAEEACACEVNNFTRSRELRTDLLF